jgi:hypothetical protein
VFISIRQFVFSRKTKATLSKVLVIVCLNNHKGWICGARNSYACCFYLLISKQTENLLFLSWCLDYSARMLGCLGWQSSLMHQHNETDFHHDISHNWNFLVMDLGLITHVFCENGFQNSKCIFVERHQYTVLPNSKYLHNTLKHTKFRLSTNTVIHPFSGE